MGLPANLSFHLVMVPNSDTFHLHAVCEVKATYEGGVHGNITYFTVGASGVKSKGSMYMLEKGVVFQIRSDWTDEDGMVQSGL